MAVDAPPPVSPMDIPYNQLTEEQRQFIDKEIMFGIITAPFLQEMQSELINQNALGIEEENL
jgi:hypothetical protein